jgi:hypothetical protein
MGMICMVKLLILPIAGLMIMIPYSIAHGPSAQAHAEQLVSNFLAQHGSYMAIYFSDIDTAFTTFEDDSSFRDLSQEVTAYQDSTIMFSRIDVSKADSFYTIYKKLNLRKDSIRIHYKPRPLGYLILHHFQLDGHPWTDSFTIDFNIRSIIKINETIE